MIHLFDIHRHAELIHSQDVGERIGLVGVEAVDGEADIDVLEPIRLWLPILVGSLPIDIVKVVNKVRRSYEIGAFDGEISLIKQHIDNLVNLGKIRAIVVKREIQTLQLKIIERAILSPLYYYASSSLKQIYNSSNRLYADKILLTFVKIAFADRFVSI